MEVHNVTADAASFTCNAYLAMGDRPTLVDDGNDPLHRSRVHQSRPIPHGKVGVAGERRRVRGDVVDLHTAASKRIHKGVGEAVGTGSTERTGSRGRGQQFLSLRRVEVHVMGFGSYDESEQENQEVDADFDDEDSVSTNNHEHDGDVEFEFDASNDELLDKLDDMKDEA